MARVRNKNDDSPQGPRKKRDIYHTPMRTRVLTYLDQGMPVEKIKQKTGVSRPTIYRWKRIKQPRRSIDVRNRGAPHIISEEEVDRMLSILYSDGFNGRIKKWKDLAQAAKFEFEVSAKTIRRHFKERGYRKCRACSKVFLRKENYTRTSLICRNLSARGLSFTNMDKTCIS